MSDMSRRSFLQAASVSAAAITSAAAYAQINTGAKPKLNRTLKTKAGSMMDFRAKPLQTVRCAFIGTGARGPSHIDSCMACEGVQIVAVCDSHKPSAAKAKKMVTDAGRPAPAVYDNGELDYKKMLERDDIDAVFIATPWEWHAKMAIDAMNAGKHAFVEVPMALTIDELWNMVETSERTQRHCMMLENVNYGQEELMVLNMCRMGALGELLHGEAAYIHDLRWQMNEIEHGTGSWRTLHYTKRNGNLYPTHGLGPVAWYMNINRGDRFDFMSSVSSNSRVRALFAREKYPEGHIRRKHKFVCGDINTSIVRTVLGKTIMVQWDEQLPRPYTRHNLIQGTRGCWAGFPGRTAVEGLTKTTDDWTEDDGLKAIYDKFDHPLSKKLKELSQQHGGHGGMDFVMIWRVIYCLRNGLPIDQPCYDGAAWSAISPLSEWSVANKGQMIEIPDFTRGAWKKAPALNLG